MGLFSNLKKRLGFDSPEEEYVHEYKDEYVEIDTSKDIGRKSKIVV